MSRQDRLIGGKYRIVRKLAEGGMGEVFEAEHNLTHKKAALKILFPHVAKDDAARQRFLREVRAPAQIDHDGIVEVFDAGFDIEDGSLFVVMELLDGESMRERLQRGGVSLDLLLDWFERILDPLAMAHEKGIVHRDLKPENVFMCKRRDGTETIKILDFGIARDLDSSQSNVTHTGIAMGTPHYMAPEQAMSAKGVFAQADVWALGVMLYEALTGRPPFDGETPSAIVVHACTRAHTPITQIAPHVPRPLSDLVDRCLQKDPAHRPANAGQLLAELRAVRQQIGSVPGVAAAAAGMAAITRPPGTGPLGSTPQSGAHAPTALLPQVSGGAFGTPPPTGGFGTPSPSGGAFGTPPAGGFGTPSPSGGAFGPPSGLGSSPGLGASGTFGAPGGYSQPKKKSGKGLALGIVAVLLFGFVLVGGGLAAAVVVLADNDSSTSDEPGTGLVRIQTDVAAGELFVDGSSRGPVVPNQQFRIERGSHELEIREHGQAVARASVHVVAGRDQAVTMNRTAQAVVNQGNVLMPGTVQTFTGQLAVGDAMRPSGQYMDTYEFHWTAGSSLTIQMDSPDLDTYLIVVAPSGTQQYNDDRPGGGLNSGLTLMLVESGRYVVQCSSYSPYETGNYTLTITAH
ncbi:MAG TPA: protein kinase [Sandaracinaceae bacterium]